MTMEELDDIMARLNAPLDREHTYDNDKADAIAAITELRADNARLRALPSVGVTVKPLEWSGVPCQWGPETYQSSGVGGFYQVFTDEDSSAGSICAEFAVEIEHFGTRHAKKIGGWCGSFTEAKAAAQADYEARILAALDVQPAPYVAQIRAEALRLGYRLGFEASGEGYNGEYMIGSRGRTIEENEDWVSTRDETLAALSTTPAPSPDVAALVERAILDAQLRCMEQGRIDTPEEIRASALAMIDTPPAPSPDVVADAEARFADWFRKNYPGPDTLIHKPDWHAPKIFRAALAALARKVGDV